MIEVKDLEKGYGARAVLRGISLSVRKGEVAAIIGPSGGGKSSLLRCITGLERFDAGSIRIGEDTLTNAAREEALLLRVRRKVGMVFQAFHLFPHLSVIENLIEAPVHVLGESRDSARERARAILRTVGLSRFEDARPRTLSGGEQQRVAIARALLMKPEALLFDEPTSALDPRMASEVLDVIGNLAISGQTMVIVTHSMSFARRAASRVHVFSEGLVVESGSPGEVFDDPKETATRAFLNASRD